MVNGMAPVRPFRFQQFQVLQDRDAPRVCTDACLFGTAMALPPEAGKNPRLILDTGTGTGLLALMLAQRCSAAGIPFRIDALEPDPGNAALARENFRRSPWAARLSLFPLTAQAFRPGPVYHMICCNPPWFGAGSTPSPRERRHRARHQLSLSPADLCRAAAAALHPRGLLQVLLPYPDHPLFRAAAEAAGLHLTGLCPIRHRPGQRAGRVILAFTKAGAGFTPPPLPAAITVCDQAGNRSRQTARLFAGFHLRHSAPG